VHLFTQFSLIEFICPLPAHLPTPNIQQHRHAAPRRPNKKYCSPCLSYLASPCSTCCSLPCQRGGERGGGGRKEEGRGTSVRFDPILPGPTPTPTPTHPPTAYVQTHTHYTHTHYIRTTYALDIRTTHFLHTHYIRTSRAALAGEFAGRALS